MARGPRRALSGVLGAAALSVGLERLSRSLVRRTSTPGAWFDNVVDFKARQLVHLVRSGTLPDVVIAGHSMTFDACEPARVAAGLPPGRAVYNAGVNLAPLGLLRDWITYVLEVAHPPDLVIGLTTVDLNANGIEQQELLERHRASVMGRRGGCPDFSAPEFGGFWCGELAKNFPRLVTEFRKGSHIGLAKAQHLIGPDGRDFHKTGATYRCSPGFEERFRLKWLANFRIGDAQVESVRSMFAGAVEAGSRAWLFIPPFTDDYVRLHPRGEQDVLSVIEALYAIAETTRCRVLEPPRSMFTTDDFADPIHLNDRGMARCSDWLARELSTEFGARA